MAKTMLINVTHAEESRVGIVADGKLVSFEIESFNREHLKGNIYKAVIHRVQPALEAAFVDIGADRDAFLPLDEICFRHLNNPPPRNSSSRDRDGDRRRPRIQDMIKPGEEILVQIVKEQFGSKPPTLSTFYSLAGRYLVLLPGSDDAGISRRIEGADRVRVRELIEQLKPPEGFGIIVRTVAGFEPGIAELERDMTYLLRLWESIKQSAAGKRGPTAVYREHDLVLRNIRDYFTPDIDEIYVDNEEVFQRAGEFLRDVMPEKESSLRLYQGDKPIFSHFNVEAQIESIYKRRVPLKSGGSIVIDGTEALTAIDVNSGRSVRGGSQEETAFKTNVEAAVEIGRQLRLRDQGGLIVIDFIDMRNPQHIGEVEKALRMAMYEDKARHEVGRISHFGLLEVSRQRLRPAAAATSYSACPMCDGHGLVRTTESAALVALRKVHNRIAQGDVASAHLALPTDVAMYLLNQKREDLAQLERRYATRIQVTTKPELMPHQLEMETKPRVDGASNEQPQLRLGGLTASEPSAEELEKPASEIAAASEPAAQQPDKAAPSAEAAKGNGKRRRRRRGKRGRGKSAAASIGEMLAILGQHVGLYDAAAAAAAAAAVEAAVADQETSDDGGDDSDSFGDTYEDEATPTEEVRGIEAEQPSHHDELVDEEAMPEAAPTAELEPQAEARGEEATAAEPAAKRSRSRSSRARQAKQRRAQSAKKAKADAENSAAAAAPPAAKAEPSKASPPVTKEKAPRKVAAPKAAKAAATTKPRPARPRSRKPKAAAPTRGE